MTNSDGTTGEQCDPRGNSASGDLVEGCDPTTCLTQLNWRCDDPSTIGSSTYNCTCGNEEGTYALRDVDSCAPTPCAYPARCLANGLGCMPGAGGNACDACLTAQDIIDQGRTDLNPAGYYKTGDVCTVCPATSAAQLFGAAAVVVVMAFFGFKASQLMGAQATNNLKKIVESLQFFSLSLNMDIEWPGPVLNIGKYLEALTFSVDFLRPECVATGLNWFNIFISSVFIVPVFIFSLLFVSDLWAKRRYTATLCGIDSETRADGRSIFWIEKHTLFGKKKKFKSEGGDKIVKELQRQYRFRATLRTFGVLSMTVLYLPIVRMCLQSYDCIELDGVDGLRLEHDIDIECTGRRHTVVQAFAAVMLAFVGIGIPVFVVLQINKIFKSGKLEDPQTLDSYGAFYDIYRRDEFTREHKLSIAKVRRAVRESSMQRRDSYATNRFDDETERVAAKVERRSERRVDDQDRTDVDSSHEITHVYVDGGIEHDPGGVNGSSHDGADAVKVHAFGNISADKTDPGSTSGATVDGEEFIKEQALSAFGDADADATDVTRDAALDGEEFIKEQGLSAFGDADAEATDPNHGAQVDGEDTLKVQGLSAFGDADDGADGDPHDGEDVLKVKGMEAFGGGSTQSYFDILSSADDVESRENRKLSHVMTFSTGALTQTHSTKIRSGLARMNWKDRFALYYLAVELAQKSSVTFATSALVSGSIVSGWALVCIHVLIGCFVWFCQPWRVVTLSFGPYKVTNCFNKVESLAAFLQALAPLIAMSFPVQRNELGEVEESVVYTLVNVILSIIIMGLLSIRIVVFVAERFAVKRRKLDIDRKPEEATRSFHKQMIKLATKRAVVALVALIGDFDAKRRKARARLEYTRQTMLERVRMLKSQEVQDDQYADKINALYEVANEMARIVNSVLPKPLPKGPSASERIDIVNARLESLLSRENVRMDARRSNTPDAEAVHAVTKVHIFDSIITELDGHLAEFAPSESELDISELGKRHADMQEARQTVVFGFGDAELRATSSALRSSIRDLEYASQSDDFEAVFTALDGSTTVITTHLKWCEDQCAVFTSAMERHPDFLPPKPPLTTTMFEDTIKLIRSHDAQLAAFKLKCIREWLPLFENFGRVSYAQGFARQVTIQATLNSGVAGVFNVDEARRVYEGVLGFANGFSSWCDDLIRVINTSAAFAYFQPIADAMTKSLNAIKADAESEREHARKALSAVQRASAHFTLAQDVKNSAQSAIQEATSHMEARVAAQMAILEEQTRLREDALVDERLRAEQAMTLLNAQFEERREDLSRDLRVAEERIAELEALKRDELGPSRRRRDGPVFSQSEDLERALKNRDDINAELRRDADTTQEIRNDLLASLRDASRRLESETKEQEVAVKRVSKMAAKDIHARVKTTQKTTREERDASKAYRKARRIVFKQQRLAMKMNRKEQKETTRVRAQVTRALRNVNARKSLKRTALGRLHSRLVEHPSRDLTARTSPQFPDVDATFTQL